MTDREEKIHNKVRNCFSSKVLKLGNFLNRREQNFKIITSSLCKKTAAGERKDNQN